jgi:type II secretory pathway component PulF
VYLTIIGLEKSSSARRINNALLMLPAVKNVLVLVERIRFNTAIALMLESGILIDRCLEMAVDSVKNQAIQQELKIAKDRVKKGESLSKALRVSPLYPDFSLSLIEVGEESGELEPVFLELSSRARREFESWVDKMTSLLEPLLILVMGGIVGGVVVTMLLSIVSVNDVGF